MQNDVSFIFGGRFADHLIVKDLSGIHVPMPRSAGELFVDNPTPDPCHQRL